MKKITLFLLLFLCLGMNAYADIWTWTDTNGDVHFVNSKNAIYTWVDDYGMVQFADKPGHESAVSVDLVWHSPGDSVAKAEDSGSPKRRESIMARVDETDTERFEREQAESFYCKRAQEIYDSYLTAPRLYETDANGDKIYLSDEQVAAKIAETKIAVDQVCR